MPETALLPQEIGSSCDYPALTGVAVKMVDFDESLEIECDLESWSELTSDLREFDGTLEQAIHSFGGEGDKSLSATTRKRLSTKSLHGLIHWRGRLHDIISKLGALKNASRNWQETVKAAEDCRRSAEGQLGEVMSEVQSTMDSLRTERAEKNAIHRELDNVAKRACEYEDENRRLTAMLRQIEGQLETQRFASDEAVASMEEIQREKENLKGIADEANKRAAQTSRLVKGLQEEAEKSKKLAERQQQVVAKLTADNLVFMMKLKETEGKLEEAAAERDLHKLAVEKKKGPWFNEIRESVEARVRDALSEAQELESQMERMRQMYKQQLGEVSKEKLALRNAVESAGNRIEELEKLGRVAESSKARAEQERDLTLRTCETNEKRVQSLEAEIRVLSESMRTIREESSKIWMKEQQFNARVALLESDLEGARHMNADLEQENASLSNQLEVQISVNREVMRRKETIEWELMEMRAHHMDARATRRPLKPVQNHPIQPAINHAHQKETRNPEDQQQQDGSPYLKYSEKFSAQQLPPQAPIASNRSDFPDSDTTHVTTTSTLPGNVARTVTEFVENKTLCSSGIPGQTASPITFQSASCPPAHPSEDPNGFSAASGQHDHVVERSDDQYIGNHSTVLEAGNLSMAKQYASPMRDHGIEHPTANDCMDPDILAESTIGMDLEDGNRSPGQEKGENGNSISHEYATDHGGSGELQNTTVTADSEVNQEPDFKGQPSPCPEDQELDNTMFKSGLQLDALLLPENSTSEISSPESGSAHGALRVNLPSTPSSLGSCVQEVDISHEEINGRKENLNFNPWEEFEGLRGSGGGRQRARAIIKTEPSSRSP